MYSDLKNKVVLITGAASGIGMATARLFAGEGCRLMLADLQDESGQKLAREISDSGVECHFQHCDISSVTAVENLINSCKKHYGRLDIAYNNAGVEGEIGPLADSSEANFDRVIATNLKSIWACMKFEIPLMLESLAGVIVNCASIAGVVGSSGIPAYVASKHGVIGLSKNAALEYASQNIRVNAVCPAGVRTPMLERFTKGDPAAQEQMDKMHPLGRAADPAEIGNAVLYLASEQASFITGSTLLVDGGYTAR